jgi:hypothetical protein|tara:strand:- start:489 stop:1160 length:672 start_codon:yes stop_codon:yes gene_type:complete
MANILVISGPQGTGNHVFSKVLSMHSNVHGWDQLLREYWVNHDNAPYKDIWNTPENIDNYDWTEHENYVLSVSGPYVDKDANGTRQTKYPDYKEVLRRLNEKGNLQVGIIGRDQNITAQNQLRKRGVESLHNYLNKIEDIMEYRHTFLSVELLYMFRHQYVKSLDSVLDIPVDYSNERLHYILNKDPNAKYVHYVENSWLDKRRNNIGHMIDGSLPHKEKDTI